MARKGWGSKELGNGLIMYRRRLYHNGNRAYHMALPADWIHDMKLKIGEYVTVFRKGEVLIVTPYENEEDALKAIGGD